VYQGNKDIFIKKVSFGKQLLRPVKRTLFYRFGKVVVLFEIILLHN
jgi:hypothetical protein